jgi:predicted metal-dependent HD superfamily phosphohydrolase
LLELHFKKKGINMKSAIVLSPRFLDDLDMAGAKVKQDKLWSQILTPYCEPWRFYHGFSHPYELQREFEDIRHLVKHPLIIELDIWLHDLFYDPDRTDNEMLSAAYAKGLVQSLGLSNQIAESVESDILATRTHSTCLTVEREFDQTYFSDLDLAILGKPPEVYAQYEENVRKEYLYSGRMSAYEYKIGRRRFLEKFLADHPYYIYEMPYFRNLYDKQARINISQSIALLSQ